MPNRLLIVSVALVALALAAACEEEDGANGPPATPATATVEEPFVTPTLPTIATPPTTGTPGAGGEIRGVDLASRPEVTEFIAGAGGEPDPTRILYGDLTGDSQEEAVLPISSGGTLGDLAQFVYGFVDGEVTLLLRALPQDPQSGITAEIQNGRLVTTEALYDEDDPRAEPNELRTVTYRWDGSSLVIDDETIEPQ